MIAVAVYSAVIYYLFPYNIYYYTRASKKNKNKLKLSPSSYYRIVCYKRYPRTFDIMLIERFNNISRRRTNIG